MVVFVGMRLAAPILNPILFAVVLALLFSPIYAWLRRHRIPTPLALVIMLVGLTRPLLRDLLDHGHLDRQVQWGNWVLHREVERSAGQHPDLAKTLGLSNVDIRDAVKPSALAGAIGSMLSGVADFLSNLFLILIIVLFLLAEGPAMMNRLRASAGRDRPQVERLTVFGRNVVRQLGLRAIVNLVTGGWRDRLAVRT